MKDKTTYHRQDIGTRTEMRKTAVKKFLAGARIGEVAEEFGVSRQTIYNWANAYSNDARHGLDHRPRGPACALEDKQLKALARALKAKASKSGFPDDRWTLQRVTDFVESEFGMTYAPRSLFHVIKKLGVNPLQRGKPRKIQAEVKVKAAKAPAKKAPAKKSASRRTPARAGKG